MDETKLRGAANTREKNNKTKKSNEIRSKSEGNSLFLLELLVGNCISLGVKTCSGSCSLKHAGCKVGYALLKVPMKLTVKAAAARESVTVLQLPVIGPLPS